MTLAYYDKLHIRLLVFSYISMIITITKKTCSHQKNFIINNFSDKNQINPIKTNRKDQMHKFNKIQIAKKSQNLLKKV